jgi:RNA polymerase sigma-B factor
MVSAGPENLLAEVDDEPRRERQRAVRRQMTSEDRTLVDGHVNLALSIARRFANRGERLDDLEQVAMVALIKAAPRFDPDAGVLFATYAANCISGELKRYFRDNTWFMKVPRRVQENYMAVRRAGEQLEQENGHPATIREFSQYLKLCEEDVVEACGAGRNLRPASLDGPPSIDGVAIVDMVRVDDVATDVVSHYHRIEELTRSLPELERVLIRLLYLEDWTQKRVSEHLGISQMQVSRLRRSAFKSLSATLRREV